MSGSKPTEEAESNAADGSREAGGALDEGQWFEELYAELRRLARRQRGGRRQGGCDGTTSIVHEAWLRLHRSRPSSIENQASFYALAARTMRSILVDNARRLGSQRRGGEFQRVDLEHAGLASAQRGPDLLALDAALDRLGDVDGRLADIVTCRFHGGLTVEETAAALGCSPVTVKRGWSLARAWLYRSLSQDPSR